MIPLVSAKLLCTQQPKLMLPVKYKDDVTSTSFRPDNNYIATSSDDGTVKIWNVKSATLLIDLVDFFDKVKSVTFSHDEKLCH